MLTFDCLAYFFTVEQSSSALLVGGGGGVGQGTGTREKGGWKCKRRGKAGEVGSDIPRPGGKWEKYKKIT